MKEFIKKFKLFLIAIGLLGVASAAVILNPITPPCIEDSTKGINERIVNCPISDAKEKANFKGREIAKIGSIQKELHGKYEIEITELNPIEGGVEFYVRAWEDGVPVGLGVGKKFEKEHFRVFNPPILVPDGTFRMVSNPFKGLTRKDNYREDLREALLSVVEHNIFVTGKKGTAISGSVGHTTSTFYANIDDDDIAPATSTVWATVHDATTGTLRTGTTNYINGQKGNGTADTYHILAYFASFDTAPIADTDIIDSVDFSLYGLGKGGTTQAINVFNSTHSDTIVGDDFDLRGTTAWSAAIAEADWVLSAYNSFSFNADGKSGINKTGLTKLCARESNYDAPNIAPPLDTNANIGFASADTTGTDNDPKLVIVHEAAAEVTGAQIIIFE